ncbi:MAG: hypothetical protein LBL67_05620 [Coriobacteriales bacterium]|jgi:hypothetical protein|nr:hypothetical protein [Coriobacteriales bacterium]
MGRLTWVLANWIECHGLMCILGSVVMLGSAIIVHAYLRSHANKTDIKMYPPSGPGGNYLAMMGSGFAGLIIANLVWGWRLDPAAGMSYIAVFIVCCAVPQGLAITYGNNWKVWLTAGAICGIIQYPFEEAGMDISKIIHVPPLVIFTTLVVFVSGIICVEIFKICPWVRKYVKDPKARTAKPYVQTNCAPRATGGWLIRRTLADFTEIMFFGNEWVGLATIIACVASWLLNPGSLVYGTPGPVPAMIFGGIMADSLALFIYHKKYLERGFFNTFCTVSAMMLPMLYMAMNGPTAAPTSIPFVIICAILIAFVAPLVCNGMADWMFPRMGKRYEGAVNAVMCNAPSIGVSILVVFLGMSGIWATGLFG